MKTAKRSILAQNIVHRREAKNWTQPELAHKAGFGLSTIKEIETDKSEGHLETRQAIADALGCSLADLYSGPDEARSEKAALIIQLVRVLPDLDEKKLRHLLESVLAYKSRR